MKDLFKKKGGQATDTPKSSKAKKPLFGKSTQEKPAKSRFSLGKKNDSNQAAKAKKPTFSFGKKPAASDDVFAEKPAKKGFSLGKTQKTASPTKSTKAGKSGQLDVNKLILILAGLLVLALMALAAKMFLFSGEPAPAEPVAAETPPSEPAVMPEPTAETSATEPAVAAEPPTEAPSEPAVAVASEKPAAPKPSYEEFIRESESRIYREHNTGNTQTAPSQ